MSLCARTLGLLSSTGTGSRRLNKQFQVQGICPFCLLLYVLISYLPLEAVALHIAIFAAYEPATFSHTNLCIPNATAAMDCFQSVLFFASSELSNSSSIGSEALSYSTSQDARSTTSVPADEESTSSATNSFCVIAWATRHSGLSPRPNSGTLNFRHCEFKLNAKELSQQCLDSLIHVLAVCCSHFEPFTIHLWIHVS